MVSRQLQEMEKMKKVMKFSKKQKVLAFYSCQDLSDSPELLNSSASLSEEGIILST